MSFRWFLVQRCSCYNYQLMSLCHISINSFDRNENHLILVQYFVRKMKILSLFWLIKKWKALKKCLVLFDKNRTKIKRFSRDMIQLFTRLECITLNCQIRKKTVPLAMKDFAGSPCSLKEMLQTTYSKYSMFNICIDCSNCLGIKINTSHFMG